MMNKKLLAMTSVLVFLAVSLISAPPADAATTSNSRNLVYNGCYFTGTVYGDSNGNGFTQGVSDATSSCARVRVKVRYYDAPFVYDTPYASHSSWAYKHSGISGTTAHYARACGRPHQGGTTYGCGTIYWTW